VTRLATEPPDRPLHSPTAIAADQQGNLFVADAGNARVVEFGPDGSFRRQFRLPSDGGAGGLRSVEVDSLGERLYLLTTTGLFAAPLSS
jgi:streptogramin lyase